MTLTLRQGDRHADRVLDVVRRGFHEEGNDLVTRSWSRCLNQYQLDPGRPREPVIIASSALQSRRNQHAD